ncbi:unnamed protein product [Symbiodinium natans]|uniref:Uncharacterized protein n=1 Tax=Symbiodinium natans TaxID=878477 RepID=A0A812PBY2_9DINO|nr:unnamed protein product [Symbiodinium natans]
MLYLLRARAALSSTAAASASSKASAFVLRVLKSCSHTIHYYFRSFSSAAAFDQVFAECGRQGGASDSRGHRSLSLEMRTIEAAAGLAEFVSGGRKALWVTACTVRITALEVKSQAELLGECPRALQIPIDTYFIDSKSAAFLQAFGSRPKADRRRLQRAVGPGQAAPDGKQLCELQPQRTSRKPVFILPPLKNGTGSGT